MKLINVDALGVGKANPAKFENRAFADGWNSLYSIIQHAPVVDAVPVVRCNDCVNHDQCTFEDTFKLVRITDGYCRVGKRKDQGGAKMDGGAKDETD